MRALRSIRGRVAALATLAVAVVLTGVGTVVVTTFAERERDRLDERLAEPSPRALGRALAEGRLPSARRGGRRGRSERSGRSFPPPRAGPGRPSRPGADEPPGSGFGPPGTPPPGLGGRALRPEGEFVRLLQGEQTVAAVDAPEGLPPPLRDGFRTVEAGGTTYRTLTRTTPDGDVLEVGGELAGVSERVGGLRARVIVVSGVGVAVVGALSWWLAGLALRPFGGLRTAVARVSTTRDLSTRLPAESRLEEVDALSESVNAMLARLESSSAETEQALEATRRFAADAGHELRTPMTALRANLGSLLRNPRLGSDERQAVLSEAEAEAERTVRLLEALQTLARGDAGASLPREEIELADLVDAALERARRRHPETTFALHASEESTALEGWPDGLQVLVENLIENAARHGRPGGRVEVELERAEGGLRLAVDDDGPGVPERERIFERFVRGEQAGEGSGLGLALVRQQARLHGGEAWVADSELGGARFLVRLARGASNGEAQSSVVGP
ncbi:MAG: HAMP domain-containing histidine kinase [Thermoleophilaceae bacterium]|nr:HAMP domain-containing histidine kinase [Thermoleophilaceae bacterium]